MSPDDSSMATDDSRLGIDLDSDVQIPIASLITGDNGAIRLALYGASILAISSMG